MVAAMEPRLIREFEALPPDSELVKVFGKFQRLSGSGFQLPGGPTLIDRIEMERVAFFERGQASAKVLLLKWEGPASQIPASQFSLWPNENTLRQPGFSGPFYEGGQVLYRHESQFGLEKGPFFIEVSVPCPSKSAE